MTPRAFHSDMEAIPHDQDGWTLITADAETEAVPKESSTGAWEMLLGRNMAGIAERSMAIQHDGMRVLGKGANGVVRMASQHQSTHI